MVDKFKRCLASAAFAATFTFALPSAHAGGGGFAGAMESTQLMNNAELVAIFASEIEQLAQQFQMYQNMVLHTANLPIQMWSSVENELSALRTRLHPSMAL